jgi:hypothetical protein
MTDHHIEAHLQASVKTFTADADARRNMIIDRMANAALGGSLGANAHADTLARAKALEVWLMVEAMLEVYQELG